MERLIKMPRMGMNVDEGTIVEWHVIEGQSFSKGDTLYSIETDKTTAEIEAPCDGVLNKIFSSSSTLPEHFFSLISFLLIVANPAESYPLYSNFFNEFIIGDETNLLLVIPIIPHIIYFFLL